LQASKSYDLNLFEANNKELSNAEQESRADWLQAK
jgi:hypothetical protein